MQCVARAPNFVSSLDSGLMPHVQEASCYPNVRMLGCRQRVCSVVPGIVDQNIHSLFVVLGHNRQCSIFCWAWRKCSNKYTVILTHCLGCDISTTNSFLQLRSQISRILILCFCVKAFVQLCIAAQWLNRLRPDSSSHCGCCLIRLIVVMRRTFLMSW